MIAVLTILIVIFTVGQTTDPDTPPPPSNAPLFTFNKAIVTANGYLCAPIGR